MHVYRGLENLPVFNNPVITIGTFDGVHLGHKKIIDRLVKKAKEVEGESIIITFEPHPRLVLNPQSTDLKLLTDLDEKIHVLSNMQIDHLVVVPFTKEFSTMSAHDYIYHFLIHHFHPHTFIIGYDHHFGNNREGNYQLLESVKLECRFELEEIPIKEIQHNAVSSTKIRQALLMGKIHLANELLGHPYSLTGKVVHGERRGHLIGFPTANILTGDKYKLIPAHGVYVVLVYHREKQFRGMMNIGVRPTVSDSRLMSIEVNIFDFEEDIYDQQIRIEFIDHLRDEKRFNSPEELIAQLHTDRQNALLIFENIHT